LYAIFRSLNLRELSQHVRVLIVCVSLSSVSKRAQQLHELFKDMDPDLPLPLAPYPVSPDPLHAIHNTALSASILNTSQTSFPEWAVQHPVCGQFLTHVLAHTLQPLSVGQGRRRRQERQERAAFAHFYCGQIADIRCLPAQPPQLASLESANGDRGELHQLTSAVLASVGFDPHSLFKHQVEGVRALLQGQHLRFV
jgi:hypothetical protein